MHYAAVLFDLDNTLHNASPHIFPHLNRSITAYICQHLQVDEAEATRLRLHYWQRYGATLRGLMRHHGTDPHHFLHHTHQFPDLEHSIIAERGLHAMLHRLPGRKIIFSNAPHKYTEAVLAIIGILAAVALPAYQDYTIRARVSASWSNSVRSGMRAASGKVSNSSARSATRFVRSSPWGFNFT
ncbi:MAG: hypothetical protein HC828_10970, partial [Blastochloris sp.]|nr:hypothetical protein [Blastochloris sp.]